MAKLTISQQWAKAQSVLEKHRAALMKRKGVLGAEVAYRCKRNAQGQPEVTDEVSICVYVLTKDVPKRQHLKPKLDGIPIDVIDVRGRQTAGPGIKITRPTLFPQFGTLGYCPRILLNGVETRVFLTSDHVAPNDGETIQHLQAGNAATIIGTTLPKKPHQYSNLVDCALLNPLPGVPVQFEIPGFPGPCTFGQLTPKDAELKTSVVKVGATTGTTHGRVQAVNSSAFINGQSMVNQIKIDGNSPVNPNGEFNDGGDSGAVVFKFQPNAAGEREIVGLLHGKEDSTRFGVACHMMIVHEILVCFP